MDKPKFKTWDEVTPLKECDEEAYPGPTGAKDAAFDAYMDDLITGGLSHDFEDGPETGTSDDAVDAAC